MLTTSIISGFTKVLLKRVTIRLLLGLMVLSSFSFSAPASASNSGLGFSMKIEAEAYSAMSGIQTQQTDDTGGGSYVGWTDPGDWMDYSVNVQNAGTYNVGFRVASPSATSQFQLEDSIGTVLTTVNVPNTGGFQNWTTVYASVSLTAGTQTLRVYVSTGGFNLNWWSYASSATTVSGSNKVATVSFNVYATQVGTLADLKNAITVQKTGETAFTALGTEDTVTFSTYTDTSSTLVINFNNALVGSENAIKIASGALMDSNSVPYDVVTEIDNIAALDIIPPAFIGAESGNNGEYVYLNFNEDISINSGETPEDTFLKSKISVATDGEHFVPFLEQSDAYKNGSRQIYLNYYNDMKIILGTNTLIKIASGTIKDAAGNLNAEMILHVSPPAIQSTVISEDNHDVTVTFNTDVYDNTSNNLNNNDNIYLVSGTNSDWTGVGENDTASVINGKLFIHFAAALSGSNNQIYIRGNVLKDVNGNVSGDERMTPVFQANVGSVGPADTRKPQFVDSYYSNSFNDVNFVFDEDVIIAPEDEANFRNNTQWYNSDYGWRYGLPSDAALSISGHIVTIHFNPYPGVYRYFVLRSANLISDIAGNKYDNSYIATDWLDGGVIGTPTFNINRGYFSHDGRKLSLNFNSIGQLVDRTIVDGVSHIKEQITISTDHGLTYSELDPQDIVSIQYNSLIVLFHDGKKEGSIQVRMNENVLSDKHNYQYNTAVDQAVAYNTPDITGYFLSNAASDFQFTENASWSSNVKDIYVKDDEIGVDRLLNSSEYTMAAGKLTLNNGLFQEGHYYYVTVNVEGYSSQNFEGEAHKSTEIFYMTAPVVTVENGITARVNLFNNADDYGDSAGTQTIIFELMNGTTPVSIIASNLRLQTGTYTANFNVIDAATDPNYTVKAFVVSKYNTDLTSIGLNLATVKTQSELDQLIIIGNNNNNDES